MNPLKQKIAIAETVGWRPHPDNDKRTGTGDDHKFWTFGGDTYGKGKRLQYAAMPYMQDDFRRDIAELPDYPNDLNAMHQAEKVLLSDRVTHLKYDDWLRWVTHPKDGMRYTPPGGAVQGWAPSHAVAMDSRLLWHATAAQRAEAFLRTIGKWEEE